MIDNRKGGNPVVGGTPQGKNYEKMRDGFWQNIVLVLASGDTIR